MVWTFGRVFTDVSPGRPSIGYATPSGRRRWGFSSHGAPFASTPAANNAYVPSSSTSHLMVACAGLWLTSKTDRVGFRVHVPTNGSLMSTSSGTGVRDGAVRNPEGSPK